MRWLLAIVALVLVLLLLAAAAISPRENITYTFAGRHLPCTVDFGARTYHAPTLYPGCPPAIVLGRRHPRLFCQTAASLRHEGYGGLRRVGMLWKLPFGPSHALMSTHVRPGTDPVLLFVGEGSCFVLYELEGGP